MQIIRHLAFIFIALWAFAVPHGVGLAQQDAPTLAPGPSGAAPPAGASAYALGSGDRIRLIVFGEEELSGEFVVDGAGRLALPLIGDLQAEGLSARALEQAIAAALRQGYLNDPRVSVEVLNHRPFYILGEVAEPGEYPFVSGLTVMNAVATAGGFTPLADQTRVTLKRAMEPEEREMPLTMSTPVEPGDTLRISRGAVYILGEVNSPGEYPYSRDLTVLKAVAAAKGFTYRAATRRVLIQSRGEPVEREFKLTPDLRVQPGDTIRIPERFF